MMTVHSHLRPLQMLITHWMVLLTNDTRRPVHGGDARATRSFFDIPGRIITRHLHHHLRTHQLPIVPLQGHIYDSALRLHSLALDITYTNTRRSSLTCK